MIVKDCFVASLLAMTLHVTEFVVAALLAMTEDFIYFASTPDLN
jgi:hypothetical protein